MATSNLLKHTCSNPLQQWLIKHYYRRLIDLLKNLKINSVLDAGCGEGFTLNQLDLNHIGKKFTGIDNSTAALNFARKLYPRFDYSDGNIYHLPFPARSFDLVICTEVLEHLKHPVAAIKEIKRVSKNFCLFSVPFEPWFRLVNFFRGKYLSTWGNHPEHVQHWTKIGFYRLVNQNGLKVINEVVAFPWLIILARRKHP